MPNITYFPSKCVYLQFYLFKYYIYLKSLLLIRYVLIKIYINIALIEIFLFGYIK